MTLAPTLVNLFHGVVSDAPSDKAGNSLVGWAYDGQRQPDLPSGNDFVAVVGGSNLRQVGLAFEPYRNDHYDTCPAVDDVNAENPSVLVCPADPSPANVLERTSHACSMACYHSPEQIDGMSSSADTYSNPRPAIDQRISDVCYPARKILCGEWSSRHAPVEDNRGWWGVRGSRMFLFPDGHARQHAAQRIELARDGLPDPNLTKAGACGNDLCCEVH